MTHEQFIAKAKEHAAVFERAARFNARVQDFERVTVQEAAIVRFDSGSRDDYILVYLDRASGAFITAQYVPQKNQAKKE